MKILKIEKGFKPNGWGKSNLAILRSTIGKLRGDNSFIWDGDDKDPYRAAKQIGVKVHTEKVDGLGRRVWRVK